MDTIDTDDIEISTSATFGQVYQYRRYPRKTVLLKNDSGETITDVIATCTADDFVVWAPGSVSGATISANEYFHVMVDFQPQTIGNIEKGLKVNYTKAGTEYVQYLGACMSGEGIAIPTADYYISVTGDDSNDGSIGTPFRSLTAAALVATAGDLIF